MYISRKYNFAFIALTKTASTSVSEMLCSQYKAKQVHTHHGWYSRDYHDCFRFTIVRNPYDRLVSIWNHMIDWNEKTPRAPIVKLGLSLSSFERFVESWCRQYRGHKRLRKKWGKQTAFLRGAVLHRIIKYEKLEEGINSLPFVGRPILLDRKRTPQIKIDRHIITPELAEMFYLASRQDFHDFDYGREIPSHLLAT